MPFGAHCSHATNAPHHAVCAPLHGAPRHVRGLDPRPVCTRDLVWVARLDANFVLLHAVWCVTLCAVRAARHGVRCRTFFGQPHSGRCGEPRHTPRAARGWRGERAVYTSGRALMKGKAGADGLSRGVGVAIIAN